MLCVGFANKRNLQNKQVPIGARSSTACGLTQRPSGEVGIRPSENRFCAMLETYGTFIVIACRPEVSDQLSTLIEDRTLVIHRGRLVSAAPNGYNAIVAWEDTNTDELQTLNVARIINCTGPSRDYTDIQSPLLAGLRAAGLIVPDALRLGFETDLDGRLIAANGQPVQGLFTLGPIRIPALWESIAIPEIRNQALDLAKLIVSETIEAGVPT